MREEVERTDGPPAQPIKKTDRKTKDEKLNNFPLFNVCVFVAQTKQCEMLLFIGITYHPI